VDSFQTDAPTRLGDRKERQRWEEAVMMRGFSNGGLMKKAAKQSLLCGGFV
jgi:hypothetical protein